ncbi:hypothetical protein PAXINDRAFT_91432, partial [Paxillus involutus ATCC 200175]
LLGTIRKAPDLYLDELQEMLATSCGVNVSRTTVWRALRRQGLTMKKVCSCTVVMPWHVSDCYRSLVLLRNGPLRNVSNI